MNELQAFYDKSCAHLVEQGEQSFTGHSCKYRQMKGDKMLKCVIGVHIPDDMYRINMEWKSVYALLRLFPNLPLPKEPEFLSHLQHIHDQSENWNHGEGLSESGKDKLVELAVAYELRPFVFEGAK